MKTPAGAEGAELSGPYDLEAICPHDWSEIKTETSFLNGFVDAVTYGIYNPQNITVRCALPSHPVAAKPAPPKATPAPSELAAPPRPAGRCRRGTAGALDPHPRACASCAHKVRLGAQRRGFLARIVVVRSRHEGCIHHGRPEETLDHSTAVSEIWRHHDLSDARSDYRRLVRYATLAASSHNTQPWKFQLEPGRISILPDQVIL